MRLTKNQRTVAYVALCILIIGIGLVAWKKLNKKEYFKCDECANSVGSEHLEETHIQTNELLPIMTPEFNFREGAKQLILLEDHLFNCAKRCTDCIKKHFLTAEGLFEEAASLDKNRKYEDMTKELPKKIRELGKKCLNGEDPVLIAQKIRNVRKPLHTFFFDKI